MSSAGRLNYWPAWVYFVTGFLMSVLTRVAMRGNPALAKERARPQPDAKTWDKKLLTVGFLLTIAMLVVAGLDAGRFHLHPALSWRFLAAGLVLNLAGMGIFLRALRENRFFSSVVRIQNDRGHTVCNTGPYSVVRHPGYTGMILGTLGLPLLLRSAWSAIPALLFVAVTIVRTHLEDAALAGELAGYRAYRDSIRYRLVPGLW